MTNHYKNIVVGIDGSEESSFAIYKAIEMAVLNEGATLHIASVIDRRTYSSYETLDSEIMQREQETVVELMEAYKKLAESKGIKEVNVILQYGAPKVAITREVAAATNPDLIICGARGLNVLERFLIGSVSESIVRTAKCDVLVVRKPDK